MRHFITTLTQRGQITLPAEIRRILGVSAKDQIAFAVEGADIRLVPLSFTLESAFGSVPALPGTTTEDFSDQIAEAVEEQAELAAGTLRQG
jgi:AbrB family looped-hinge helix DNA binding protein